MPLSYRRIIVDGSPVGLLGVQEVFESCYAQALYPGDEELTTHLIAEIRMHNYIPTSAKIAYGNAILYEYNRYIAQREGRDVDSPAGYGFWRGYPREQIPWFPTINEDLCDGCGKCLRLCSSKALAPTEMKTVIVSDPYRCIVGCSSCAVICKVDAITFPSRSMLDAYPGCFTV